MLALLAESAPVDWLNPMPGMIVQFSIFFFVLLLTIIYHGGII